MKRLFCLTVLVLPFFLIMNAQDMIFKVEVSTDSLYFGNPLGVKFTIKNIDSDFVAPEFEGFQIVAGPNISSQYSMINGAVTQSASYEYILSPAETGVFTIPEVILGIAEGEGQQLKTEEVTVLVLENLDGIRQDYSNYNLIRETIEKERVSKPMSKEDSLKMKLRKIKTTKI